MLMVNIQRQTTLWIRMESKLFVNGEKTSNFLMAMCQIWDDVWT